MLSPCFSGLYHYLSSLRGMESASDAIRPPFSTLAQHSKQGCVEGDHSSLSAVMWKGCTGRAVVILPVEILTFFFFLNHQKLFSSISLQVDDICLKLILCDLLPDSFVARVPG